MKFFIIAPSPKEIIYHILRKDRNPLPFYFIQRRMDDLKSNLFTRIAIVIETVIAIGKAVISVCSKRKNI